MALIVVDFDGTITESDSLVQIVQTYAPQLFDELEGDLDAGRITLHQCIEREFAAVRGDHDAIVAEAVARVRVRPGFAEFVAAAQAAGHRVVVVSSGFEAIIRPVLVRDGVPEVELFAHDVRFSAKGGVVDFRYGEQCDVCGQECKRSVVRALRDGGDVVYVGDGYSDRCAALAADRVFARRELARDMEARGVAYEPFDDFVSVRAALGL
ncbi:MAG TPA: HAD-IB family phosphatase [Gaiellales bacterium]|nr:HAD-IB family phosphatase [Gaiellales bacterium]